VRFIDFDFNFIEDTFGAHEEVSGCRIHTPDNSRTAIDFHAESTIGKEPIQHGQVTRKDAIFGVVEVGVFHTISMAWIEGKRENCVPLKQVTTILSYYRLTILEQQSYNLSAHKIQQA
jgi:hypothetical protein